MKKHIVYKKAPAAADGVGGAIVGVGVVVVVVCLVCLFCVFAL